MFDLGFWEIAIIAIVALVVIKPKDMPALLRSAGKFIRKIKKTAREFTNVLSDVSHDVQLGQTTSIIADDGTEYQAYGVKDLNHNKHNKDESGRDDK